jgi:hypothetical protein
MIDQYASIQMMLTKFTTAQRNGSKEVRFTVTELSDIVSDITKLSLSQQTTTDTLEYIKTTINQLSNDVHQTVTEYDGGTF